MNTFYLVVGAFVAGAVAFYYRGWIKETVVAQWKKVNK